MEFTADGAGRLMRVLSSPQSAAFEFTLHGFFPVATCGDMRHVFAWSWEHRVCIESLRRRVGARVQARGDVAEADA